MVSKKTLKIQLPWPPKGLSPNDRVHHMVLYRLKKNYKNACCLAAIAAGAWKVKPILGRVKIIFEFYPPDRRRRDLDNCIGSMKSGADGVAAALGVDDSEWEVSYRFGDSTGGFVNVSICVEIE